MESLTVTSSRDDYLAGSIKAQMVSTRASTALGLRNQIVNTLITITVLLDTVLVGGAFCMPVRNGIL